MSAVTHLLSEHDPMKNMQVVKTMNTVDHKVKRQVAECKEDAMYVCKESRLRYCKTHKHPHGTDAHGHTFERITYKLDKD